MKQTKVVTLFLCTVMILSLLAACGTKAPPARDDVPVDDIQSAVEEALGKGDSMNVAGESYIKGYLKITPDDFAEECVMVNSKGANIDEYGIIKGSDEEQTKALTKVVEDYFTFRKDIWMSEYMPEEYPKLENAEFKVIGNYVMYAILSDDEKAAAFKAFEDSLK